MATPIPVNAARFTLEEIARATGGRIVGGEPRAAVTSVSTDTRSVTSGALFVALAGETHDGHAHLASAQGAGAAAALVRPSTSSSLARVEVDDTLVALGRLARFHVDRVRSVHPVPSIAITGSAGKTTTKELTAAIVRALYGRTLVTSGNLNNRVGVPMTLLALVEEDAAMVIECGTSARGEIARLGEIVTPDVAVVLNADAGHTAGLGTVDDVADEKAALWLSAQKAAVGNRDDAPSFARLGNVRAKVSTFGTSEDASVRLVRRELRPQGTSWIELELPVESVLDARPHVHAELALLGEAAALDAAAAVAAVLALRSVAMDAAALARVSAALASVRPTPGRMVPRTIDGALVLDDTYNANPRSMRASMSTARELAALRGGRVIFVLGDMLELGALSDAMHDAIVRDAADANTGAIVVVGDAMIAAARRTSIGAREANDGAGAAGTVADMLRDGDVVLVKGSHGMRMERAVDALVEKRRSSA